MFKKDEHVIYNNKPAKIFTRIPRKKAYTIINHNGRLIFNVKAEELKGIGGPENAARMD